jgi:hypothetical protein
MMIASQSMGESVSNFNRFIERAITNMALLSTMSLIPLLGAAGCAAVYTTNHLHLNNRMSENGMNIQRPWLLKTPLETRKYGVANERPC